MSEIQQVMFQLDPVRLKAGKDKCPCCGKLMRAYRKTLDQRLVDLAFEAVKYMNDYKVDKFKVIQVFEKDHHKVNDFQKLKYFGIFRKLEHNYWELTPRGYQFLFEGYRIGCEGWIFNNKVVDRSEEKLSLNEIHPRWQEGREDYVFDYMRAKYNLEPKLPLNA